MVFLSSRCEAFGSAIHHTHELTMHTNSTINAITLASSVASLILIATGCNTTSATPVASSLPKIEVITPIVQTEMLCPISGEVVTELDAVAFFDCFPVYCKGRANARQFAALPMKQRSRLAADQVLAQKGIANRICPLTGETLTAAGSPVVFETVVIGFASIADANQFRSLPLAKKSKMITEWKAAANA